MESELDQKIDPAGWAEWQLGETSRLETAFYAEYASAGPGASPEMRETHAHQLSKTEAKKYVATSFLAGSDGWNPIANESRTASKQ
jgi:pectinesterase